MKLNIYVKPIYVKTKNIELKTEFRNKTEYLDTGFYPVVPNLRWVNLENYIVLT